MGARARFCALARTLLSVPLMSGQMIGRLVPPIRDLAFPHVVKHKNQKSREKSHFSFNRSFFFLYRLAFIFLNGSRSPHRGQFQM